MVSRRTILLLLLPVIAAGCRGASTTGDKAGGTPSDGTVVLRLASTPSSLNDVPPVDAFVRRVWQLSHGALRIQPVNQWGNYEPGAEAQVVRSVASGSVDLGWAGSRVFDSMGLSSFQAVSAPMLIDSYPLEEAVLHGPMAPEMLDGLKGLGVTPVGILADVFRHPIGVRRPLLGPASWRRVSFGTYRSGVQEQAIRALGARPVVAFGPFRLRALQSGTIQGFEFDIQRYQPLGLVSEAPYIAANVLLWPQVDVLFANPGRLASLTSQQRAWLRQAVADAGKDAAAKLSAQDAVFARKDCAAGARFALATRGNLAALRRAFSSVYRRLERDPQTRTFIRRIEQLKRSIAPGRALRIPAGCPSE